MEFQWLYAGRNKSLKISCFVRAADFSWLSDWRETTRGGEEVNVEEGDKVFHLILITGMQRVALDGAISVWDKVLWMN